MALRDLGKAGPSQRRKNWLQQISVTEPSADSCVVLVTPCYFTGRANPTEREPEFARMSCAFASDGSLKSDGVTNKLSEKGKRQWSPPKRENLRDRTDQSRYTPVDRGLTSWFRRATRYGSARLT
jgi:hypothetical protein